MTDVVFPPIVFLRDAKRLGLPSASTLLRMSEAEGLRIHRHPTRGKYIKTAEYMAHMDAMEAMAQAEAKAS